VRELRGGELGLVHAKQTIDGELAPDIRAGDVDWPDLLAVLKRAGYRGPLHFELPAGADIWERLVAARAKLVAFAGEA
jgi:sugar phosphate isomerase/epimerase